MTVGCHTGGHGQSQVRQCHSELSAGGTTVSFEVQATYGAAVQDWFVKQYTNSTTTNI